MKYSKNRRSITIQEYDGMQKVIAELKAENERLRQALSYIAGSRCGGRLLFKNIAQKALEE